MKQSFFFSLFSLFFTFFRFFSLFFTFFRFFSLNFRFTSIFSLNFRLFYLHFRFRFLVFHIEVNHVKSGIFFASKRNKIFASISNFASEAKVRAHPIMNPTFPHKEKTFIICDFVNLRSNHRIQTSLKNTKWATHSSLPKNTVYKQNNYR